MKVNNNKQISFNGAIRIPADSKPEVIKTLEKAFKTNADKIIRPKTDINYNIHDIKVEKEILEYLKREHAAYKYSSKNMSFKEFEDFSLD